MDKQFVFHVQTQIVMACIFTFFVLLKILIKINNNRGLYNKIILLLHIIRYNFRMFKIVTLAKTQNFFLSQITHYCTCSHNKHLNKDCFHNIAAVIFHTYMVVE